MSLQVEIEKKLNDKVLSVSFDTEGKQGITGILGASGCGKSMTLKCIAGIETPDRGKIVLNGRVLFDSGKKINLRVQDRHVGYLFQNYALFPNMTVEENIAAGFKYRPGQKMTAEEIKRQTADYKMIKVDGVEVSDKTIRSGKYALCRDYYVAYKGKLNSVEQDFLRYIMSAGQKEVDKICVGKKKAATFLSDRSEGTISIEGSSSVAPIMEKLIAGYASYNPKATITLKATDSSDGLNAAIRGDCDLAMSSRALKDYEKELLSYEVIGSDAIAIVLQKNNPITDLSTKQIRDIYNGKYPKWSDIN